MPQTRLAPRIVMAEEIRINPETITGVGDVFRTTGTSTTENCKHYFKIALTRERSRRYDHVKTELWKKMRTEQGYRKCVVMCHHVHAVKKGKEPQELHPPCKYKVIGTYQNNMSEIVINDVHLEHCCMNSSSSDVADIPYTMSRKRSTNFEVIKSINPVVRLHTDGCSSVNTRSDHAAKRLKKSQDIARQNAIIHGNSRDCLVTLSKHQTHRYASGLRPRLNKTDANPNQKGGEEIIQTTLLPDALL
jgi:hypothetical protein